MYENTKYQIPNTKYQRNNSAFTLVELAIVVVIIGLIVGGVVGGQSLIESAKIKAVVSNINEYRVAYNAYKLEYDAVPGDHKEASLYFSTDKSGGSSIFNGNGDGMINGGHAHESMESFSHLLNAELINNCKCWGAEVPMAVPDKVFPLSPLGLPNVYKLSYLAGGSGYFRYYSAGNSLILTSVRYMGDSYPDGYYNWTSYVQALNGPLAYKIDKKVDDGKPFTGLMRATTHGHCQSGGEYRKTALKPPRCQASIVID